MAYQDILDGIGNDAEQLELVYQTAVKTGEADAFSEVITANYTAQPDNLLYAAWHYRLAHAALQVKERAVVWAWAIPLAVLNGLLLWFVSGEDFFVQVNGNDYLPVVMLVVGTITATFILLYLTLAGQRLWRRAAALFVAMAVLVAYVLLIYPRILPYVFQEQYLTLMVIHLALVSWTAIGLYVLWSARDADDRFAFLIKSLEAIILGGLFGIALSLFTGITFALFDALGISPPDEVVRLFVAGGGGMIPLLAVAILYDPTRKPAEQSFDEGLSRLIALLMRILLIPTLLVLLIYLAFIPFNFRQPFENRDVLITYNIMLFAVMILLVGVTPVRRAEPSSKLQRWLRWGMIGLAALALLDGIYAFSAIAYRTAIDKWTPNRITFIGWNLINIGILILLLVKQFRAGQERWLPRLRQTFATSMIPYALWTLVIILALPWLFGVNTQVVETLPASIQKIVYEEPYPILLKCAGSPHIYLLEDGEKRWVKDIPTFETQGFEWPDVERVSCDDLVAVPDGLPIPEDAGTPPEL